MAKVGYRDIENIPDDEETIATGEKSPCIGRDALSGVYYHPAPALGSQPSLSGNLQLNVENHIILFVLYTNQFTTSNSFLLT